MSSRGMAFIKESLDQYQEEKIRTDLVVKPFIPPGAIQEARSFPIYRESNKKIYVPRFYARDEFKIDIVPKVEEHQRTDASYMNFTGELRPYQKNIVSSYMKTSSGCGLLEIPCGRGKTVMGLHIISQLKLKTIVIVHKEFLLNQWVERIQQFLPNARIGKIQGKIIDIVDKDIVIGMLQSLSMKDYDKDVFSRFGLTIIDECHHICAEVFSRSLFKIVTPYMLGLSATMERKDRLSFVFKMFLGDIVYTEKREANNNVNVRCVRYRNDDDEEYSKTIYNFKGQTHYAVMIKKLCEYEYRTEMILRVLEDVLKESRENNYGQQIMILAHNRSLLRELYEKIEERKYGSVGFYVGGMKEKDLKQTETKEIIVATYAMAEEALDIKTLSALILATPKTDVTQAVGRILRTKHCFPLIVDIVDQHDIFEKQWVKRRRFYKKCGYNMKEIVSNKYHNRFHEWSDVSTSTKKKKELLHGNCYLSI